ncbi:MAG: aldolase catalytic domain-containing protein [Humidesulfovibrio sp.]|uniref:aldolase catalytic domain-containing protein n=1 Tax=Humidesulfovibrio sp. TaxID=2910988 RepID=UPI0027FBB297|nr:aldolase catalytic domain-containing protein [Humidesulfovibrio sp.]MDQ7834264.1 aldolase catalytic domain-containing protein [Humidesulfovibrio sp.]
MNHKPLEVLDCTLRDGGYINNWDFPPSMAKNVFRHLSRAGVDVVEVGLRDANPTSPLLRRCPDDLLAEIKGPSKGARLAVMVDYGKADEQAFAPSSESPVEMVRVAVHRDKIKSCLSLLQKIKNKGYQTSIQLMGYPQYSKSERRDTLNIIKDSPPDYVYIADSNGSLFPDNVQELLSPLVEVAQFKVGFHPHNNLQLAFANALEAIRCGVHILDSTLYGMGRGAGNLPTETLLAYLQHLIPHQYNVVQALLCVDLYLLPLSREYIWGYQLPYVISGFCQCHPSYAKAMVETRRYTIDDVWKILNLIHKHNPVGFDPELLRSTLEAGVLGHDAVNLSSGFDFEEESVAEIPSPPEYAGRHSGRPFLILANGPSLRSSHNQIKAFIKKYNPIVMGANFLGGMFTPHYHAFTSKKRFITYVDSVAPESRLLLSPYFGEEFIRQHTEREWEPISYLTAPRETLTIEDGVISNDCYSVSMLLIAVAAVMGAGEVFVAGMDGYLHSDADGSFYFYEEKDDTASPEFNLTRQRWGTHTLALLDALLVGMGLSGVNIITPTDYERYYRGIKSLT